MYASETQMFLLNVFIIQINSETRESLIEPIC